ncbi:hypothetical protein [Halosegnis marinus]|uniref:Uncharacterized protein n=1 Tax=Halosegnis marinus TaxID=3034023 RepID=A0ABD5ZL83_9EURY|nr:hypothetical protein [Halosegnis sp. DT85]
MSATDELLAERDDREEATESSDGGGRLSGVRSRLRSPFSLRAFLVALLLSVVASAAVGLVPFLPGSVATVAGVFVGAFALGLVRAKRAYLETALAGTAVVTVAALTQFFLVSVVGNVGIPVAAAGAGAGLLAALLGHYFGRDLRAGLTRDL